MRIVTSHDRPPIPTRACDWSAYDADRWDGDPEAPAHIAIVGRGPTEAAAIADFHEKLAEVEEEGR